MNTLEIVVLYGGVSDEREVSLVSGKCVADALKDYYSVRLIDLKERCLPSDIDKDSCLVFPVFHGAFGEDGQLQALLEGAGIEYVGSDAKSSALCLDKVATKECVKSIGVGFIDEVVFDYQNKPSVEEVVEKLGEDLVVKPVNNGSSIGFSSTSNVKALRMAIDFIKGGRWMIEKRIRGRDLTIAVLDGKSMGIVEIKPTGGVYDYERKYTPGTTEYEFPAKVDKRIEREVKESAEEIFRICGCRDYGRVDYMLSEEEELYFMEINTIPGCTPTSLLPKSLQCEGYDFKGLCRVLVELGLGRFEMKKREAVCYG